MGKKCYDNAFSFNLFIYDLDNNVYECFTNQKFSGVNMKEAVSNAIQWIEKSFSHFDSLEWVIESTNAKSKCHFSVNGITIEKLLSSYND